MFGDNTIFGPDGVRQNIGNTSIGSDGSDSMLTSIGSSRFTPDGRTSYDIGDMTYLSSGEQIQKVGNTYYANGMTYTVTGNVLTSSDGRTWSGVYGMSDADARNIIINDIG